jgi:hypothetical protein
MEAKDVYMFCIRNCVHQLKTCDKLGPEAINAFRMSEVLAIAFCKLKEDVLNDIITCVE